MYDATDVSKWFLANIDRESGESITHLKLQKLLYYAQAWNLVLQDKPMFSNRIEAWMHGPVVPDVYSQYSANGYNAIDAPVSSPVFDDNTEHVLREIMRVYGKYDAKYLEELTHNEEPWLKTRGNLPLEARCNDEIPLELMKDFYTRMQNS